MPDTRIAVVLGGKTGLLGMSLTRVLTEAGWTVHTPARDELNLFDCPAVERYLDDTEPDVLFNTVAYTQVDKAEDEPEDAARLNKTLPENLAKLLQERPVHLFHYSTDFVFNGRKDTPYEETDETDPQSVYGSTKLAGERAILSAMPDRSTIARTAWLFGPGKRNFVHTILGLCKNRGDLSVVHDQVGSPTYTTDLARMSLDLVTCKATGIVNLVNAGQASWCELAAEAANLAEMNCMVNAVTSAEYPQKAKRPAYSVLDTARYTELTGKTPRPWMHALRDYIFQELWDTELLSQP